jgi:hypothetical protein
MKYVNYKHVCIPICHAELPTCTSPLACSACPSSHWQRDIGLVSSMHLASIRLHAVDFVCQSTCPESRSSQRAEASGLAGIQFQHHCQFLLFFLSRPCMKLSIAENMDVFEVFSGASRIHQEASPHLRSSCTCFDQHLFWFVFAQWMCHFWDPGRCGLMSFGTQHEQNAFTCCPVHIL